VDSFLLLEDGRKPEYLPTSLALGGMSEKRGIWSDKAVKKRRVKEYGVTSGGNGIIGFGILVDE